MGAPRSLARIISLLFILVFLFLCSLTVFDRGAGSLNFDRSAHLSADICTPAGPEPQTPGMALAYPSYTTDYRGKDMVQALPTCKCI